MSTCLLYFFNFFKKNNFSGLAFEEYDIMMSLAAYFLISKSKASVAVLSFVN
ncbi:MAG: hypothetical protein CM15mP58_14220 [Burkholderiaceae bacterium]|nr:MAG: hypothetical protein CM15mP58_14220 [Burkholderiaceae bacterium]